MAGAGTNVPPVSVRDWVSGFLPDRGEKLPALQTGRQRKRLIRYGIFQLQGWHATCFEYAEARMGKHARSSRAVCPAPRSGTVLSGASTHCRGRANERMSDSEQKRPRSPSPPPSAASSSSGGRPPSPSLSPVTARHRVEAEETIPRVTVGGSSFYAFEHPGAGGHQYFHPLNPDTGAFSRFPHVSFEGDRPHATDIANGGVSALDIGREGRFTEKRVQKKKKPVALGHFDPQGRELYARDNTAARSFLQDPQGRIGLAEPLSPRTARHLGAQGPHRLLNASPGPIESAPLTEELARARIATLSPFPLPASSAAAPPPAFPDLGGGGK